MAKLLGLVRRGAVFYFRRRVPRDVREAFGRDEVIVSLHTTNRKVAADAWLDQWAEWEDVFDRLRSTNFSCAPSPTTETSEEGVHKPVIRGSRVTRLRAIRRAKGNHDGLRPLNADIASRLARTWFLAKNKQQLFRMPPENAEEALQEAYEDAEELKHHPSGPSQLAFIQEVADVLLDEHQLGGFPGEEAYERLCEYLSRAQLELARRNLDYLRREFGNEGYDHLFRNEAVVPLHGVPVVQDIAGGITVAEARDQFQAARVDGRSDLKDRSKAKVRTGLELTVEFFGADTHLGAIDTAQCEAFQEFLRKLPPNFNKVRNGRTLQEVAEATAQRGAHGLLRATRESYFAPLRQMLAWAKKKRLIAENPALEVTEGRLAPHDEVERHSFTSEQLRQIFNAPLYRGCVDDENGFNTPGPNHPRKGRFWLPLLGLFTGARLGELCQMRVDDVRSTETGTVYIRIHAEGPGMSVKNKHSSRSVPIHPELIRIGFLEFVERQRKASEKNLFPEVLIQGRMAAYRSSKLFNTFRKSVGVNSSKVCFHSFRHTFRDALGERFTNPEIIDALGGWSETMRTSSGYGEGYAAGMAKDTKWIRCTPLYARSNTRAWI